MRAVVLVAVVAWAQVAAAEEPTLPLDPYSVRRFVDVSVGVTPLDWMMVCGEAHPVRPLGVAVCWGPTDLVNSVSGRVAWRFPLGARKANLGAVAELNLGPLVAYTRGKLLGETDGQSLIAAASLEVVLWWGRWLGWRSTLDLGGHATLFDDSVEAPFLHLQSGSDGMFGPFVSFTTGLTL